MLPLSSSMQVVPASITENDLIQNVSGAEAETLSSFVQRYS